MSFAVWKQRPPFAFDQKDREQIYQVGDKWVVTDDPARATQAEVDAVLAPKPDNAAALDQRQVDEALDGLDRAIDAVTDPESSNALRIVRQLLQGK